MQQLHFVDALSGGSHPGTLTLSDCIPAEFLLNRLFWVDLFTESILLIPLVA